MKIETSHKIGICAIGVISGVFNAYNAWQYNNQEAFIAWIVSICSFIGLIGAYIEIKRFEEKN